MGAGEDFVVSPSKNVIFKRGRSFGYKGPLLIAGVAGGRIMFNTPDNSYGSLGDATNAGIGSIAGTIARALMIAGAGPLYLSGISRAISASTTLQLLLWYNGSYSGAGSGPFTVGTNPTAASIISASATASTIMTGAVYSVRIWPIRTTTGGRARASIPSNVLTVIGKKVIAGQFPTIPTGYDRWGIAATQPGFGATGPHYKLPTNLNGEVLESALATIETVPRAVLLEWSGGDLIGRPLAPIDDYPPPACVWVMALNDAVAAIACYGDPVLGATTTNPGTAISVSERVYIESFPAEWLLFMPQAPIDAIQPSDNFGFIGSADYIMALVYTGARPPMVLQTLWKGTGIAVPGNMVAGEGGRLYVMTPQLGLVRVGDQGQPDNRFAEPVFEDLQRFTAANTRLGWDSGYNYVLVGHLKELLCFDTQTQDSWTTPLDLTGKIVGDICAFVTVQGRVRIATNDGTTIRLYYFNSGTGTVSELYYPEFAAPDESVDIMRVQQRVRIDNLTNPVEYNILKNGDTVKQWIPNKSQTPTRTGKVPLQTARINVHNMKSYQWYQKIVGLGGDCGFEDWAIAGEGTEVAT